MIAVGNELRQRYGANILAERILQKIEDDKHYVIDSIRNPAEVEAFRAAKHFKLIRIEAPQEVRFRRILSRHRESDPRTWEEFIELEKREAEGDETSQNLVKVELMADHTLTNDGSLENLYPKIDELLLRLLKEIQTFGHEAAFTDDVCLVAMDFAGAAMAALRSTRKSAGRMAATSSRSSWTSPGANTASAAT